MRRVVAGAILVGGLAACVPTGLSIVMQPAPAVKQPPIPSTFEGDGDPTLEKTDQAGLFYVPELGPNVYFYKSDDLWYRYAYHRWYQAFRWDGNWFILQDPPEVLAKRKLIRRELPELPD